MVHFNNGSHGFACRPVMYPQMERAPYSSATEHHCTHELYRYIVLMIYSGLSAFGFLLLININI